MTKINQALCREATVFPEGFNYTKLDVYFLTPNVSLRGVNLSGADLREANLDGARLNSSDLRYANLSGASLRDVHLFQTILIAA